MSLLKTIGLKLIGAKGIADIESAAIAQAAPGIAHKAVQEATKRIANDAVLNQSFNDLRSRLLGKIFGSEARAPGWVNRVYELKAEQKNPVVLRSKILKEIKEEIGDSTRAGAATDLILDLLK